MALASTRILPAVAAALAYDLGASMQSIANAADIGRTTLHRHFPTRQDLTQAVADYALLEADRIFDEAGIGGDGGPNGALQQPAAPAEPVPGESTDLPAREALAKLAGQVLPLATVYALLWADPPVSSKVQVEAEVEARDARLEHFAKRGQNEGCFRSDVPPRWIVHSLGSQAIAVGWAVRVGDVGAREAARLFRTTVVDGLGQRPA